MGRRIKIMNNKIYDAIGENVFSAKLDNGLMIYVIKKEGFAKKYAYFATNYGGADRRFRYNGQWIETPMGVAHFLEHKMFDMPDGNALNMLSEKGASPNAYTSLDITAYHFECVDNFYDNLKILLNFVSTPYFTKESVEKEQGIIGQEIGMINDNPGTELYYGFLRCLYENNPIRDNIAGTVESIAQITSDTLYACHKVFYNPSNMVLCVVGDVDPDEVLSVTKSVITQSAGDKPQSDYGTEADGYPFKDRSQKNMQVASPMFIMGSKVDLPENSEEHLRKLVVGQLAMNMFAGESSPLYNELYSKGLIMPDFSGGLEAIANTAYTMIGGESRDVEAARKMIIKEAERVTEAGFDDMYFRRCLRAAIGQEIRTLNRFDDICYNVAKGYFRNFDSFMSVDILKTVTKDEVKKFIASYLSEDKMAISVVDPIK